MLIYIGGFALSTVLLIISTKKENITKYSLAALALIVPCLIAGLRDVSVGTDVQVYLRPMYEAAMKAANYREYLTSSWYHIWLDLYVKDYEIGFRALVYLVSKIGRNLATVQFAIQAFTIVPVYLAARRNSESLVWISMLVYYLMFYNTSLNLMRQCIAMAFVLLAVQYLSEEHYLKFFACVMIGFLFHNTALIGFAIGIIYILVTRPMQNIGWKIDSRNIFTAVILVIGVLLLVKTDIFVYLLEIAGLEKYIIYIDGSTGLMPKQLLTRLPVFLLLLIHWKSSIEKERNYRFYLVMMCLDMIFSQFTSVNAYGGRIALFFSMFHIISLAYVYSKEEYKKVVRPSLSLYLLCYWLFFFVIKAKDSTIPYLFAL